jgi:pilus assembly protein FimV
VHKTLLKVLGLLACMVSFNLASAGNMGGINVTSALGHPLKAEILLAELGAADKSKFVAKMASVNEFKSAGLDYPYSLPKLNFEIVTHANGETYIKITSTQPVNEPFVSLLIELSWPSGRMLREYTFLLDPIGFVAEQPKVAEVKPVEPMLPVAEPVPAIIPVPALTTEAEAMPAEPATVAALPLEEEDKQKTPESDMAKAEAKPARVMSDMEKAELAAAEMAQAEQVPAEPGKVEPAEVVKVEPLAPTPQDQAATATILVEKGDTLGKIADQLKPVDVSLERMLVAMYRVNAKTFDGKNMNRIKAGKILRMPESDDIDKITQKAAVKEIRAQVADWQDYRQKLAAAQSTSTEEAPKQESAGKINAAVAEKAPAVKDSAKEVLKLSKGESLGDKAVAGSGAKGKQEKLLANADDAAAKSKQMQEEQKKVAALESINKDASKLVELKGLPATASTADKTKLPESSPAAASKGLGAVSAVAVTQPVAEELDILGEVNKYITMLLEDPVLLGAGVAVLLGLGGLGLVMARRGKGTQKKSSKKPLEVGAATGSWRTPVAPSPDTGDFTQSVTSSYAPAPSAPMSVAAALDDVDPISEADLFLNFGRDAQAEEILKDALSKNSSNIQVKLKLLSIYANRKDSNSFSKYAQEVKDSGDAAAWERAAVMGREVDPSNPTYGGAKGEPRQREAAKAEVDFDLGMDNVAVPASSNAVAAKDFKMDFDLTGGQPAINAKPAEVKNPFAKPSGVTHAKPSADVDATSILSRADVQAAQSASPMDFDVSGILPGEVKQIAESTSMDFDISGILPEDVKKTAQSTTMDFDLSGISEDTSVIPEPVTSKAPAAPAMDFGDLVFEIPTSKSKPAEEKIKPAADEGMAFTIDFPTSSNLEPASTKPASASKLDIDFGDINIHLDDESPAHAGGEGKDEQWHEVATKLDLAKAYQEMGDADGAREILEEVIRDGDVAQRESAEKLLQQIAA